MNSQIKKTSSSASGTADIGAEQEPSPSIADQMLPEAGVSTGQGSEIIKGFYCQANNTFYAFNQDSQYTFEEFQVLLFGESVSDFSNMDTWETIFVDPVDPPPSDDAEKASKEQPKTE